MEMDFLYSHRNQHYFLHFWIEIRGAAAAELAIESASIYHLQTNSGVSGQYHTAIKAYLSNKRRNTNNALTR